MNKNLFVLAGKNYTTGDFADYIEKNSKKRSDKGKDALLNEYYDGFSYGLQVRHYIAQFFNAPRLGI